MNTTKIIDAIVKLEKLRIKREHMALLVPYPRYVWHKLMEDSIQMQTVTKTNEPDRFYGVLTVYEPTLLYMRVVSLVSDHIEAIISDCLVPFNEKCSCCGYQFNSDGSDLSLLHVLCPTCKKYRIWNYTGSSWIEIEGGIH